MTKSKLKYVIDEYGDSPLGLIWETPKGQIITLERHINPERVIRVRDAETGDMVKQIDMLEIIEKVLNVECEKPEEKYHQITMDEYLESLGESDA